MKRNSGTSRWRVATCLALGMMLALVSSLMVAPKKAYASATVMMVADEIDGKVVDLDQGVPVVAKNKFVVHFKMLSYYDDNQYFLKCVNLETGEVVATADNDFYLSGYTGSLDLSIDATNWDPGNYVIYAKTYGYTSYGWDGYENNDQNYYGYVSCLFELKKNVSGKKIKLSKTSFAYNGKVQRPKVKTVDGRTLKAGTDYTLKYSDKSSKKVGSYTVWVVGKGGYTGTSAKATYKITKKANKITVKATSPTIKAGKTMKAKKVFTVKKATGALTYEKATGDAKILVDKSGNIKVKKGLKPGTYTIKVKVKAAGNSTTKAKTVKVKVRVVVK